MIYQIIFQFIVFVFASFVSFYVPGSLVVSFFKVRPKLISILLSYVFGIVMWAMQGYIFGYLNMRWLTYLYIGTVFIASIYRRSFLNQMRCASSNFILKNKVTTGLIFLGIIVQLIPVAGSGLMTENGLIFFGNNAYDGLTHLGFIQSLISHFPPVEPGAYGLPLRNYHYLSDLVIAELSRIWKIPTSLLLFQFMPFLVSLFTGVAAYLMVKSLGGSKVMANWMLFLLYFAGDGAYIFVLILHGTLGFNTPAIDNGAMQFLNMPNAMAKMIFISSLIPLQYYIASNKKPWGIFSVLFLAPLVGFKIYFGIFSILGFSFIILKKIITRFIEGWEGNKILGMISAIKKEWFSLFLMLLFAGIVLAIYIPANGSAGGLFYAPLEWPKSLLGAGSLDWKDWWLRMQVYVANNNYRNIFILDFAAIIITLVSIYGTRLLGFFPNFKLVKFLGWEKTLFFMPGLFLFQFLGLYTLQVTGGLNVLYFFVVSTFVLSLFSSFTLGRLSESKKIFAKVFLVIFIFLTIPRVVSDISRNIDNYKTHIDSYVLSNEELSAMRYLDVSTPKEAIIQAHPANNKDYEVGYLATFSKRLTYLSGIVFLETRNQKIVDKKIAMQNMFKANTASEFKNLAKNNNIQYVYLRKIPEQNLKFVLDQSLKKVFENESVLIIKII